MTITEKLDELEKTARFRSSLLSDYVASIKALRVAVEALDVAAHKIGRCVCSNDENWQDTKNALADIKSKLGVTE
jgi:hypothetical protein